MENNTILETAPKRKAHNLRLSEAEITILQYNADIKGISLQQMVRQSVYAMPRPTQLEGIDLAKKLPRKRRTKAEMFAERSK